MREVHPASPGHLPARFDLGSEPRAAAVTVARRYCWRSRAASVTAVTAHIISRVRERNLAEQMRAVPADRRGLVSRGGQSAAGAELADLCAVLAIAAAR